MPYLPSYYYGSRYASPYWSSYYSPYYSSYSSAYWDSYYDPYYAPRSSYYWRSRYSDWYPYRGYSSYVAPVYTAPVTYKTEVVTETPIVEKKVTTYDYTPTVSTAVSYSTPARSYWYDDYYYPRSYYSPYYSRSYVSPYTGNLITY